MDVVAFADAGGVTVVPEIEGPGHSAAMRRSVPFFNGEGGETPQGGGVLNVANASFYSAFEGILEEAAQIFESSPYMHIGCDETSTPASLPGYAAFTKKNNISDPSDLFAYYVKRLADKVSSLDKQAVVWSGASTKVHKDHKDTVNSFSTSLPGCSPSSESLTAADAGGCRGDVLGGRRRQRARGRAVGQGRSALNQLPERHGGGYQQRGG